MQDINESVTSADFWHFQTYGDLRREAHPTSLKKIKSPVVLQQPGFLFNAAFNKLLNQFNLHCFTSIGRCLLWFCIKGNWAPLFSIKSKNEICIFRQKIGGVHTNYSAPC